MSIISSILKEKEKIIIGQEEIFKKILICLLSEGHVLLVGVPGVGKTLIANTIAKIFDLSFSRIQFTPDLMPSDIIGFDILEEDPNTGKKTFTFKKGPIFSNVVLADEINRTSPKTQSALLESMQEKTVTLLGKTYKLEEPFFVIATQNPIEQEGTYPLPEAQLDRFMMQLNVEYPSLEEEIKISTLEPNLNHVQKVVTREEFFELRKKANQIFISEKVVEYIVKLVRATRPGNGIDIINKYVEWGVGPRAAQHLVKASKSFAFLNNSKMVLKEHVDVIAKDVLKHRIILNYSARIDSVSVEEIIEKVMIKAS